MSVDKFNKHQRSKKAPLVLTNPKGEEFFFADSKEYLASDYRKKLLKEKAQRAALAEVAKDE